MEFSKDTKIGKIFVEEENGFITKLGFRGGNSPASGGAEEPPAVKKVFEELEMYLDGRLKKFTVPIKPEGTEFQKIVWQNVLKIPFGETATYREIAIKSGNSRAVRAVGAANNRNPIAIIIPCHRVIGADGKIRGYAGGAKIKEALLKIEGAAF